MKGKRLIRELISPDIITRPGSFSLPFLIVLLLPILSFRHRLLLISQLRHRFDSRIHDLLQLALVFLRFHLL